MSDERTGGARRLDTMFALFAEEQRKLAEFQKKMASASTVTESANKMVTATFDGRGELVKLVFNNTKYRSMAPAELATMVTDTIRRGRASAFGKIGEMAGGPVIPGVDFGDLAAGQVDLDKVVNSMLRSAFGRPTVAEKAEKSPEPSDG
uniref:YbaB/EbfC family nucleoid-associated protein n=1 Tax=Paractinoplanes polyasparticus TaxID=2856853 RepID=UPI001C866BB5|nr:YbaB/EbfC family nucleoid-associated protein [Actinoplanes polyasparticus]